MDARDFLQTKAGNATWLNEFLAGYRGSPPPYSPSGLLYTAVCLKILIQLLQLLCASAL